MRLIGELQHRETAPDRVWDWQRYATWRGIIWGLLRDFINDEVKRRVKKRPPDYVGCVEFEWLDDLIWKTRKSSVDIKSTLTERIITPIGVGHRLGCDVVMLNRRTK